jgi:pSer/pThr/pTyr-binding forkhead associated (FHA) protein
MIISERPSPVFAWLVIVDGPDRNSIGTVHTLHPDTTTLGRVSGNRIVLHDETVSAQHARIRREVKEGQEPVFALFDMGSRNGIYAGARENYKNEENRVYRHELKDGDYLLVGDTTLVFKTL